MAYDRYDTRRDRDWRGSGDTDRFDRGGRRDERGFWDRAGDEVASWFGDDDAERRRNEDARMDRDRGDSWSGMTSGGWAPERDYDRGYGRDYDRDRGRDHADLREAHRIAAPGGSHLSERPASPGLPRNADAGR